MLLYDSYYGEISGIGLNMAKLSRVWYTWNQGLQENHIAICFYQFAIMLSKSQH